MLMKCKCFRDPIYGYINISEDIIYKIVDTAGFQRLRNVIQTSYAPLYSSAVHNRFVHSLGVYHLGSIVSNSICKNKEDYSEICNIERILEVFEIACLLHDLGHAPFSHTGEMYYLNDGKRDELHREIVKLTNDMSLQKEIKLKNYNAAPHELMSVIVALKDYDFLFDNDEERSFFARCIIGYPYVIDENIENSFKNCVISLLNSAVIDVDKLDYLIRDAYLTGFDTVSIDYQRLLQSIKFRKDNNSYKIVYTKGAISVIENVVYAHDAERKWIQNHPVVQYESYLLQSVMRDLKNKYIDKKLFSYEALTKEGIEIFSGYKISLLSDADITFLMKNLNSEEVIEYYNRNKRRHPLWKSEAEYKAIFSAGYTDKTFDVIENAIDGLTKYLNYLCKSCEINATALDKCEEDIKKTEQEIDDKNKKYIEAVVLEKKKHLVWLNVFSEFASEQGIDFNFIILKENQFNSGFAKEAFGQIQIEFPSLKNLQYFKEVTNTLKADKSSREKFFYLFYKRKEEDKNKKVDLRDLAFKMGQVAMKNIFDEN